MKSHSSRAVLLTEGTPWKRILAFSVPLLIGAVFQQVYNLVDTVIVGRFLGEEALAGVGATHNITMFVLAVTFGLTVGAGIITAQCFGAQAWKRLRAAVSATVTACLIMTVISMAVGLAGNRFFLRLLQVPEEVLPYAAQYLEVLYWLIGGQVAYNGAASILRSVGDSRTPLIALIVSSVLNIALDILFVTVIPWGVRGAALATAISQIVSAVICIVRLYKERESVHLTGICWKPEAGQVRLVFRAGLPQALQSCLISFGNMAVQRLINSFGVAVMAAYAGAIKVDGIAVQFIVSVTSALAVFTGQNMGRRDFLRIRQGLRSTLFIGAAEAVAIAALTFVFGQHFIRLFLGANAGPETIAVGAQYLRVMGAAYLMCVLMRGFLAVITGAGDVNVGALAGFAELAGRVAFSYLLAPYFGILGVWIATPISWGCGAIVPMVRYFSGKWKQKALV